MRCKITMYYKNKIKEIEFNSHDPVQKMSAEMQVKEFETMAGRAKKDFSDDIKVLKEILTSKKPREYAKRFYIKQFVMSTKGFTKLPTKKVWASVKADLRKNKSKKKDLGFWEGF